MTDERRPVPFPVPMDAEPDTPAAPLHRGRRFQTGGEHEPPEDWASRPLEDVEAARPDLPDEPGLGGEPESSEPEDSATEPAVHRSGGDGAWAQSANLDAAVLPFRRPRHRRLRRLRRSAFVRWLRPLAAALLIVGLPVAFLAWLLTAPPFAFVGLDIQTTPTGRVATSWVHRALAPYAGHNLWRLDLGELEQRLVAHPWIADAGLRKRPPGTLEVELVERRQTALYRSDRGLAWVDTRGQLIEPVDLSRPDPGLDLPILSGSLEAVPAALDLIEEIHTAGEVWAEGLSEIEILGPRDFRVYTTSLPFPLVVRTGSLHTKARHLRALLPRLVERFETIDAVDLRFARRIIIQQPADSSAGGQKQRA